MLFLQLDVSISFKRCSYLAEPWYLIRIRVLSNVDLSGDRGIEHRVAIVTQQESEDQEYAITEATEISKQIQQLIILALIEMLRRRHRKEAIVLEKCVVSTQQLQSVIFDLCIPSFDFLCRQKLHLIHVILYKANHIIMELCLVICKSHSVPCLELISLEEWTNSINHLLDRLCLILEIDPVLRSHQDELCLLPECHSFLL